jgi:hypothetical protein
MHTMDANLPAMPHLLHQVRTHLALQ